MVGIHRDPEQLVCYEQTENTLKQKYRTTIYKSGRIELEAAKPWTEWTEQDAQALCDDLKHWLAKYRSA